MMMLWLVFAVLTLVVAAVLLLPLLRGSALHAANDSEYDRAVYRDQLAELERDLGRGLISAADAEAARNEISRRLLQTESSIQPDPVQGGSLSSVARFSILLVPLVAIPVYLSEGEPGTPDVPLQERLAKAVENKDMPAMLARVEKHLAEVPDDLAGWRTIIPPYRAEQRWADAANAYANVLRLSPPTADLYTEYAEMLMLANNGDIGKEAHEALRKALELEPANPKAVFFEALALKQEGNVDEARKRLTALLATAPADATYRDAVQQELNSMNGAKAPALSNDQMQAGAQMSSADRATMINTMIEGLEQRLGTTSTDLEGWKRLIRARTVNQQMDKAKASLGLAETIFKSDQKALDELKSLAAELGISP